MIIIFISNITKNIFPCDYHLLGNMKKHQCHQGLTWAIGLRRRGNYVLEYLSNGLINQEPE